MEEREEKEVLEENKEEEEGLWGWGLICKEWFGEGGTTEYLGLTVEGGTISPVTDTTRNNCSSLHMETNIFGCTFSTKPFFTDQTST